ncbi:DM DNA binding domain-containing protein [Ditylenchus destructor]|uniref:DM DNA binding domain-containing protein n=1 Tax=Ditylenchus destructor TaxID=166010 RepID=A0AAD4QWP3_9BILA|nr:DM DNA binding domain-containing protein [Ditylenchus destructor]
MFPINNIFELLNNGKLNMANCNFLQDINNGYQCGTTSNVLKAGPRYHKEHPPYCHCCANHDVQSRLKGHKNCPFQLCECPRCKTVKRRRRLMAEQIKERRRQRKLAKEAAKMLENNQNEVDFSINQCFDFAALSFAPEEPFNMPEMNTQIILDAAQFNNIMFSLPQTIPMSDQTQQYAGINPSDIGCSSSSASISPNNSTASTSDELNAPALALFESLQMTSLVPSSQIFSIPPPLDMCAPQPGIWYNSMNVPVSPTLPLPIFPPNESFAYTNSQFSLSNTFLQQIKQSFFNDLLHSSR